MYRYINPGHIALFQNTPGTDYKTTTNKTCTKTGIGFSTAQHMQIPLLPAGIKEIWIKFDYYNENTQRYYLHTISSSSTYCGVIYKSWNVYRYINGNSKDAPTNCPPGINTIWIHLKSDSTNGIYEIWINGVKDYEFIGNVLKGEDISEVSLSTNSNNIAYVLSNIIVSDSPISLTEQVVTIPCTITTDMTKNEDGSYSATAVDQTLGYGIDTSSFAEGTKFTGVNIAARNCIRDGEGVNNLEFLEGATSLDTQIIPTTETCGLSYGITLNDESPATFALHNYKLKAK